MLTEQAIDDAVRRVVAAAHQPVRVILFGSYARGEATDHSDLDLIVVERGLPDTGKEMIRLHDILADLDVSVDVLVYSEAEFDQRRNWCSTPVYWAAREGKVLYEHRQ
jgi:predicted nucleotidyltransferase